MNTPLQITYRNFPSSEALGAAITDEVDRLEKFCDRITACHVVVELPHRSHRQGKAFHVRVDVSVPGQELVVGKDHGGGKSHEDPYAAVSEAFDAMRRQLRDYVERRQIRRGQTGELAVP